MGHRDVREWISFVDPENEHRTLVFDTTFLRSSYHCVFGAGCKGIIHTVENSAEVGCCNFGAHFLPQHDDIERVVAAFERLEPSQMQYHDQALINGFLVDGNLLPDGQSATSTAIVDGACIFLNRSGFAGGPGCALHLGAIACSESPIDWKPNVCWQVPFRLENARSPDGHLTSWLREWVRRDWGVGGAHFDWWCTDSDEAYTAKVALYVTARDEIVAMVGLRQYEMLVELLEQPRPVALPLPKRPPHSEWPNGR